ncbi:Crp/Fnr family transcriptional regulator [Aneurinibacillus aneurinilyticus]|uniref:Crp/Fnr family transcriptional regulator n=1 Tax=Aneurinibacillus aneurinilyticus TaxID=1391 RepID=A0A848CY20_ANEAE|nr:Crp/Fnr family transcriptional regulator [Aneurinibacillus aneurinilyticus]MCI1693108.1 Crp/Fnr family transcriptional regulator [Aneurinibacillus aneurinilyticus]MED0671055.1 Crp/Fnr family transcriptional regulator [Aneurinibacillus aneurinilyticus]NME98326.1 Crp/Fnr family transcriptional regulator [Aneurinibacillus aneurinilyticus]
MIDVHFLRHFPFFEHLGEDELTEIAPLFITRKYEKGANVFFEEEEGDELYIIKSGVVKIYRDDNAREIILAIFREGDFFGEMAVLQNEQVRSASARTLEQSTLYVLKRFDFISLLNRSPDIFIKILETALDRLRRANELITDLTILDARTRIVRMILRLTENHGLQNKEGLLIDLKLTHQQMADMTGTVRETVTKILLDLQNQQLIRIDKKKIIICNINGLRHLIEP